MPTRELVIGADVAKDFSEICILGLDHSVHKRLTVQHDSKESMEHLIQIIKTKEKGFFIDNNTERAISGFMTS